MLYFFLFKWYLYISKDIIACKDYADVSRVLRVVFFILLSIGFSLAGVAAVASSLAVSGSGLRDRQWAHAEDFMDLTESQQSQRVLKKQRHVAFRIACITQMEIWASQTKFSTWALAVTSSRACFDMLPRASVWTFSHGSRRPGPSEGWTDI